MNTVIASERRGSVCLKENVKLVHDIYLRYELNAVRICGRKCYTVTVETATDHSTCCFGCDRRKAIEIYKKIVENEVTPCTLRDIAEDFTVSRK